MEMKFAETDLVSIRNPSPVQCGRDGLRLQRYAPSPGTTNVFSMPFSSASGTSETQA